jgi:hypothetical protein
MHSCSMYVCTYIYIYIYIYIHIYIYAYVQALLYLETLSQCAQGIEMFVLADKICIGGLGYTHTNTCG